MDVHARDTTVALAAEGIEVRHSSQCVATCEHNDACMFLWLLADIINQMYCQQIRYSRCNARVHVVRTPCKAGDDALLPP